MVDWRMPSVYGGERVFGGVLGGVWGVFACGANGFALCCARCINQEKPMAKIGENFVYGLPTQKSGVFRFFRIFLAETPLFKGISVNFADFHFLHKVKVTDALLYIMYPKHLPLKIFTFLKCWFLGSFSFVYRHFSAISHPSKTTQQFSTLSKTSLLTLFCITIS